MNALLASLDFASAGYWAAALLFLFFAGLLIAGRPGRAHAVLLTAAALTTVLWSLGFAWAANAYEMAFGRFYLMELVRFGVWGLFLLSLLGVSAGGFRAACRSRLAQVYAALLASGVACLAVYAGELPVEQADRGFYWAYIGLLGFALFALVLVEQVYRNTAQSRRWAIKFLCLGLGAWFAFDIYLYADALLLLKFDPVKLNARGYASAIIVPLLAVSIARSPQLQLNIFVSRHAAFYGTALVAAGLYLLVVGAGGFYIRLYGGSWGDVSQIVFSFAAAIFLATVLLSSQARRRLKVFLVKHFFSNKYDYRIEWLNVIESLSRPADRQNLAQTSVRVMADIIGARGGCLWLSDDGAGFSRAACWNMKPPRETRVRGTGAFTGFMERTHWVIDLREKSLPEGFAAPAWLDQLTDAWLVVPLIHRDRLFGFVVLEGGAQTERLNWEDRDLLKTVGKQITSYLAHEQAVEQLSQSRQFEAFSRMSAFMVHDIKNLVSQLSLVTRNASQHMHNPMFIRDSMETIDNCVDKMNALLTKLNAGVHEQGESGPVELKPMLERLVAETGGRRPAPRLKMAGPPPVLHADAPRLENVIRHLLHNAQDAAGPDGGVEIELIGREADVLVVVSDDGAGMSEQFIRERLFKPFDSTKAGKSMGIGAFEAREYVRTLGGAIDVNSQSGRGTVFYVTLPVEKTLSRAAGEAGISNG
jgi:putative PEP-CTERM system histidine kinase